MSVIAAKEMCHHITLLSSLHLNREVKVECWYPAPGNPREEYRLILVNDGQLLHDAGFPSILSAYHSEEANVPVFCVGIHAGKERLMEYGTIKEKDYLGRGARAGLYARFVMEELLPWIRMQYRISAFREKIFAGFSLGGLSALDIVLNHPFEFSCAAVFSGSLWWRNIALSDEAYSDERNRIIHNHVTALPYFPWMRFFFECGTEDEAADRNNNGVIDSIDDTLDLIKILKERGYGDEQVKYLEIEGGKHDAKTWGAAWPAFLRWG